MLRVIPHADDLGLSDRVNDAIFKLMEQGLVKSASLLACGPAIEAAARQAKRCADCSFGIHLCATDLRPLTSNHCLAPIIAPSGSFIGGAEIGRVWPTSRLMRAVFDEWIAQFERLQSLGVSVSHIDSHHHVHTRPWLFPVLKRFQRASGIRRVRLSMNVYAEESQPPFRVRVFKSLYNAGLRSIVKSTTTDGFTSFATFSKVADRLPPSIRTLEAMLHPGHPAYESETAGLESLWKRRDSISVRFISYLDLPAPLSRRASS